MGFFETATQGIGSLEKVTMDKRGAHKGAIDGIRAGQDIPVVVRKVKHLSDIVEQDHRSIRITRPMLGFK